MAFYQDKLNLAYETMQNERIDLWIVAGQESATNFEPVLSIIGDHEFIGETALMFFKDEDSYVVCTPIDKFGYIHANVFKEVIDFPDSFEQSVADVIRLKQPKVIALDYSENDPSSDGLTTGTYMHLQEALTLANYQGKVVSAQKIINRVRGIKSKRELEAISKACEAAEAIFTKASEVIKDGVNCQTVYDFFQSEVAKAGYGYAWPKSCNPGVFSGPNCPVGHMGAPDVLIRKGHVVNIDFGVKVDGYSCDLQRMYYVLKDDETDVPKDVLHAFETIRDGIQATADYMVPGVSGLDVDTYARNVICGKGYEEWGCATGHQMGSEAHDGGSLLAPAKPRYNRDDLIRVPLEVGNVFTIEPGITCSAGHLGMEEDVVVTPHGATFLTPPQQSLILIKSK